MTGRRINLQAERLIKVNAQTGRRTTSDDPNAIWEPFTGDTDPESTMYLLMGSGAAQPASPGLPDIDAPFSPTAPIPGAPGVDGTEEVAPPQPIAPSVTSGTGGLY